MRVARICLNEFWQAGDSVHDPQREGGPPDLGALLTSPARYIGVLDPRRHTADLPAVIGAVFGKSMDRLYAPAGLDLEAEPRPFWRNTGSPCQPVGRIPSAADWADTWVDRQGQSGILATVCGSAE